MTRGATLFAAALVVTTLAACHKKQSRTVVAAPPPATPSPTTAPTPQPVAAGTPRSFGAYVDQEVGSPLRDTWKNLKHQTKPIADALTGAVDDISAEDEKALGQATALEIIRTGGGLLIDDEPLVRYLNRVGNLVAQQGSRRTKGHDGKPRKRSRDFVFGILDDDASVNAFSTPGGYVFITSGLVRDLGSESELAWVLGHEVGHVDLEHNLKALKIYLRERAVAESFANVTGDTNARERWKNATFFQAMAAHSADVSRSMNGRGEEREADVLGLEYAVAAGYDANGATRVLEMLGDMSRPTISPLATHDPPLARRDALAPKVAAASLKHTGSIGAARFTHDCIDRLDAIRAAKK